MNNATKFGLLNSAIGLLIGLYITYSSIGEGYWILIFGAPISAFVCGFYFYSLFLKKQAGTSVARLVGTGLLTGTISHYVCWVLLSIGLNICYWTTGSCLDSLGKPPAQIWQMMLLGVGMTGWSLLFFGWITIPSSIGFGFLVERVHKKKDKPKRR